MRLFILFFIFVTAILTHVYAQEICFSGVKVAKGSNVTINIELPKLYNTPTQLPIRVIRGKEDGPTVFISAAIHGDEINGIEIIRRFRKLPILKQLKGTVVLIPIVNIYGVMNLSRYLPDRRDLNRNFPGSPKGSLTSRVADVFFNEVVKKFDLGIDLHTASNHRSNLPQIRTNIYDKYTLKLAKAFKAPVVLHSDLLDGSLRAITRESGIPVLLYESGEALRFDELSIRVGVKGIVNVLEELKMLPKVLDDADKKQPVVVKHSSWLRSPESGIIRTIAELGSTVKKGDLVAYIYDPLDDNNYELLAPFDGIIIGKSELPLIQEGDALFHIANFKKLLIADQKINYFCGEALDDEGNIYMDERKSQH